MIKKENALASRLRVPESHTFRVRKKIGSERDTPRSFRNSKNKNRRSGDIKGSSVLTRAISLMEKRKTGRLPGIAKTGEPRSWRNV